MAAQPVGDITRRHVVVRFADNAVVRGSTADLDLDRVRFSVRFDGAPLEEPLDAVVPLAAVKRVLLGSRAWKEGAVPEEAVGGVAIEFQDGEVLKGLLPAIPDRRRLGMNLELIDPQRGCVETHALPYHAVKTMSFLAAWEATTAGDQAMFGRGRVPAGGSDAPLVDLLAEIRGLRGLRHRGRISELEYERRRRLVLERI